MTQQTIVFTFDNANSNTTVTQSFDMESINYLEDGSTTVGILHQYPTVKNVSETQYLITSQLDGFCMLAWFPPKRSSMTDSSFKEVTSVLYILIILAYLIFTKKYFKCIIGTSNTIDGVPCSALTVSKLSQNTT